MPVKKEKKSDLSTLKTENKVIGKHRIKRTIK